MPGRNGSYEPVSIDGDIEVYIYKREDRGGTYWVYYRDHKTHRHTLKTKNRKVAHRKAQQIAIPLGQGLGGQIQQVRANRGVTCRELVERVYSEHPKWSDTTKEGNRAQLERFLSLFGETPAQSITTDMLVSFVTDLRKTGGRLAKDPETGQMRPQGISNSTHNKYKAYLSTVFRHGMTVGVCNFNPAAAMPNAPTGDRRYEGLHEDQLNALLEACPPHTRRIATILADTGLRHKQELGSMTRAWLHLEDESPHIAAPWDTTKNSTPRRIPLTQRLQAIFREIIGDGMHFVIEAGDGAIVREYRCPNGQCLVPYLDIRRSLRSAARRAGLDHVHPHMLRHTFVTRLLDANVPLEAVNHLAGHKSFAMTKRYDHAELERYVGAIAALDGTISVE